jgi:cytochrome c oxidase subunit II
MQDKTPHFRRLVLIWLVSSIVLTLLVVLVLTPGMPPGNGTVQSSGQVIDDTVLLGVSTPIALAVLLCMGYSLIMFRQRPGEDANREGPAVRGNSSIQMWWLVVTTTTVLFLAAFGTIELLKDGAGGGQGPNPMSKPAGAGHALEVQVIAQQWEFTYRYPGYGGVETNQLEIPANTVVEFNVTSLDVIHSFWAYQLGVKADANPGENNIAYVTTKAPMNFEVHCAELCGVWHGYMYNSGRVVPKAQFASWIAQQTTTFKPVNPNLPKYDTKYFPAPQRRGG